MNGYFMDYKNGNLINQAVEQILNDIPITISVKGGNDFQCFTADWQW